MSDAELERTTMRKVPLRFVPCCSPASLFPSSTGSMLALCAKDEPGRGLSPHRSGCWRKCSGLRFRVLTLRRKGSHALQNVIRADPCICRDPEAELITPNVARLDMFVPGAAKLGELVRPSASIRTWSRKRSRIGERLEQPIRSATWSLARAARKIAALRGRLRTATAEGRTL
jgi:hypothetical protein